MTQAGEIGAKRRAAEFVEGRLQRARGGRDHHRFERGQDALAVGLAGGMPLTMSTIEILSGGVTVSRTGPAAVLFCTICILRIAQKVRAPTRPFLRYVNGQRSCIYPGRAVAG